MVFKKGTYIINRNFDTVILLADDYDTKTDEFAEYVNYFTIKKRKNKHKKVKNLYAEYKDLNGGSLTVEEKENWGLASKYVIKLCEEELKRITEEYIKPLDTLINLFHKDIEEFLDAIDSRNINKITKDRIKKIYEKYSEDIYNIDKFPNIFKDLYFNYCYIRFDDKYKQFYIDGSNLFPNSTKYLCIVDIFSDEKICGENSITLRTVYENYYKKVDREVFRTHIYWNKLDPKEIIKQLEREK